MYLCGDRCTPSDLQESAVQGGKVRVRGEEICICCAQARREMKRLIEWVKRLEAEVAAANNGFEAPNQSIETQKEEK